MFPPATITSNFRFYRTRDVMSNDEGDQSFEQISPTCLQYLRQQVNRNSVGRVEVNLETVEKYHL
jgi:hypothetical protein